MNTKQIIQKLNTPEYNFLGEHQSLGGNIILLTTGGSYAYGTNVETSDLDIRGICLNSKDEILTMNCKDKPVEDKATDTVIYYLKQIIQLLLNTNPNVIEMMGTKEDHLFILSKEGKLLRDNIGLFLSKRASHSFGGYAISQLRRLQNALARDHYPQSEKENHILGSIEGQMNHLRSNYQKFTGENLKVYIDKSDKDDFDTEIFVDIDLKHYPLRDFKGMYSDMANVIKDYERLNHRNSKKDDLHLNKHAMHLIRLFIMGTEILEGKGVNTHRKKDRDLLMKIRNGEFVKKKNGKDDYSEFFELVDDYDKRFKYALNNTSLPDNPDYASVNELVKTINIGVVNNEN